jgi:hypothetical protein
MCSGRFGWKTAMEEDSKSVEKMDSAKQDYLSTRAM